MPDGGGHVVDVVGNYLPCRSARWLAAAGHSNARLLTAALQCSIAYSCTPMLDCLQLHCLAPFSLLPLAACPASSPSLRSPVLLHCTPRRMDRHSRSKHGPAPPPSIVPSPSRVCASIARPPRPPTNRAPPPSAVSSPRLATVYTAVRRAGDGFRLKAKLHMQVHGRTSQPHSIRGAEHSCSLKAAAVCAAVGCAAAGCAAAGCAAVGCAAVRKSACAPAVVRGAAGPVLHRGLLLAV